MGRMSRGTATVSGTDDCTLSHCPQRLSGGVGYKTILILRVSCLHSYLRSAQYCIELQVRTNMFWACVLTVRMKFTHCDIVAHAASMADIPCTDK